jgi:hypothetical protein
LEDELYGEIEYADGTTERRSGEGLTGGRGPEKVGMPVESSADLGSAGETPPASPEGPANGHGKRGLLEKLHLHK